jgi:hypothetical protein
MEEALKEKALEKEEAPGERQQRKVSFLLYVTYLDSYPSKKMVYPPGWEANIWSAGQALSEIKILLNQGKIQR